MKCRRVFVTLELDSTLPLSSLRSAEYWTGRLMTRIHQAQVNVAKAEKKKAKKK